MGGSRDVFFHSEVGQEGLDFWGAHLNRVALVMEEDEAVHPVHVGLFGAVGAMFESQNFAELVRGFFPLANSFERGWSYCQNFCLGG